MTKSRRTRSYSCFQKRWARLLLAGCSKQARALLTVPGHMMLPRGIPSVHRGSHGSHGSWSCGSMALSQKRHLQPLSCAMSLVRLQFSRSCGGSANDLAELPDSSSPARLHHHQNHHDLTYKLALTDMLAQSLGASGWRPSA